MTEEIHYEWDYSYYDWYIYRKYTYAHDARGNMVEETSFDYDTASLTYTGDWKDIIAYDLSVDWADIALPQEIMEDTDEDASMPIISKPISYTEKKGHLNLL